MYGLLAPILPASPKLLVSTCVGLQQNCSHPIEVLCNRSHLRLPQNLPKRFSSEAPTPCSLPGLSALDSRPTCKKKQSESLQASSDLLTETLVSVLDLHGMTDALSLSALLLEENSCSQTPPPCPASCNAGCTDMQEAGVSPNKFTWAGMLKACGCRFCFGLRDLSGEFRHPTG